MNAWGQVIGIRRYPVKSMQGEVLVEGEVTGSGVVGDRTYAVQDVETGFIASAKHPRKWGVLLRCRAAFLEPPRAGEAVPPVCITLPDGTLVSSADPERDSVLSAAFGRAVRLVSHAASPARPIREADRTRPEDAPYQGELRQEPLAAAAPPGTFFDYAALHLITTPTLAALQALYPDGRLDALRFRPNLVVEPDPGAAGFVENRWLGQTLAIRNEAELHLIDPCPRCVVTTLAQDGLPYDREILRTIAAHSSAPGVTQAPGHIYRGVAGVYAAVSRAGRIRVGDRVGPR
jgi:uncharacterized protein YcbX